MKWTVIGGTYIFAITVARPLSLAKYTQVYNRLTVYIWIIMLLSI